MKEAMPCKYGLPLLVLAGASLVLLANGEFVVGAVLLGVAALVSVIIGESQFWVEKEDKEERQLQPEYIYRDYVIMCKRNERDVLSLEEWSRYVRLVY